MFIESSMEELVCSGGIQVILINELQHVVPLILQKLRHCEEAGTKSQVV